MPITPPSDSNLAWLLASCAALLVGPALLRVSRGRLLHAVDGFVVVAVAGLVAIEVLPHAVATAGPWALAVAAVGLLLPPRLEAALHSAARKVHLATVLFALAGLMVHAAVDGAALIERTHSGKGLAFAVIAHRIPVGLAIWWLVRPQLGAKVAWSVLATILVGTFVGYFGGNAVRDAASHVAVGVFDALVAGSLLHVVIHRGFGLPPLAHGPRWSGIGGLVGAALVAWLIASPAGHGHDHGPGPDDSAGSALDHGHDDAAGHAAAQLATAAGAVPPSPDALPALDDPSGAGLVARAGAALARLAHDAAPALLLGYLLAGLLGALLPPAGAAFLGRGGPWQQAARGVAFGLPLPLCSCGVVPVYRQLIRRGVPPAAALGFFVATPEIGIDAAVLSVPMLGLPMTLVRIAAAALVAIVVGWLVGRALPAQEPAPEPTGPAPSWRARAQTVVRIGFGEVVDATAPWVLLGLLLAALADPLLDGDALVAIPPALQVPMFAAIGLPLYICASGATPLVATLLAHGASPGAALALLLTGPATNITTFGMLRDLHGGAMAWRFGAAVAGAAVALGWGVDALWPAATWPRPLASLGADGDDATWAIVGLGALVAAAWLRTGPRAFLATVFPGNGLLGHGHDHDAAAALDHPPDGTGHGHDDAPGPAHGHGHHDGHHHDHGGGHDHGHNHGHHHER